MSYILEALKKSDQQRKRGAAPTLLTAQHAAIPDKKPAFFRHGLLAALLICAGILIGWLRPWENSAPVSVAETPKPEAPLPNRPAPAPKKTAPPKMPPEPEKKAENKPKPAPEAAENGDPEAKALSMAELPSSIQAEIPKMSISVHAYSKKPAERLVGINNHLLKEGDSLSPGLSLEKITPEGMIFSYKGYFFRQGMK